MSVLIDVLMPPGLEVLIEFRFHFHIQRTAPPLERSISRTESPGVGFSGDQVKSATSPFAAVGGGGAAATVEAVLGVVGAAVPPAAEVAAKAVDETSGAVVGAARSTTTVVGG